MEFMFGFGVGFSFGMAFLCQIAKIIWYDNQESVWEKYSRERKMVNDALEKSVPERGD